MTPSQKTSSTCYPFTRAIVIAFLDLISPPIPLILYTMHLSSLAATCFGMIAIVSAAPAASNGAQSEIARLDTSPNPLNKRQSAGTIMVSSPLFQISSSKCLLLLFPISIDVRNRSLAVFQRLRT